MQRNDDRIAEAKRMGMAEVMQRLDLTALKRAGVEWIGPCPICGGDDRFSINTRKEVFQCRKCDGKGDAIGLVRFVMGLDFPGALEWLCGPVQQISAEERARRDKRDAENAKRKEAEAAAYRKRAIADAKRIWDAGLPADNSPVAAYLALRGITAGALPRLPICLRFAPDLPYMVESRKRNERGQTVYLSAHRGPAMLAAIQGADNRFCAVHRTWFDLTQPQGKVLIKHPETGEVMARKKILGSKKGGSIRLRRGASECGTLVMAEGIETTFTAAIADVWPAAHFWSGVDLGNMAGRRESGPGLKFAGLPDLGDMEAFVPPAWVELLIYVKDGDSDPRLTQAQLEAGLRRAMALRPGLRGQIAPCPEGLDLNDVLLVGGK
jgi:hypothetical protein